MKITYVDAVIFIRSYVETLSEKVVGIDSALRILDLMNTLGKYYDEYNAKVESIKVKYAVKDENGKPIQNEYGYSFEEESQLRLVEEINKLGRDEIEVNFTPLEKSDLDGLGLTIGQIGLLKIFIKK